MISILSNLKYLRKNIGIIDMTPINNKFLFPSPKNIAGDIDRDKSNIIIILLFCICALSSQIIF
jgi:hypothetical protein